MLIEPGRVLLLGEVPGTAQSPAFIVEVIERGHEKGLPIHLALELKSEEQEAIDRYLAGDGSAEARRALVSQGAWIAPRQDGRTSVAMVDLLEAVRLKREQGVRIHLTLFDRDGETPQQREVAMANLLQAVAFKDPYALTIILTSNDQSRIRPGRGPDRRYQPLGRLLGQRRLSHRLIAVDVAHAGGEAWHCADETSESCAAQTIAPRGPQDGEWITLQAIANKIGHHGWYHVGALEASPPAASVETP